MFFLLALQLREDHHRAADDHAPGFWEVCQHFAKARDLCDKGDADTACEAAMELLKKITFASSSDYSLTGKTSPKAVRLVQDALKLHDRVTEAAAGSLLEEARASFGPRSVLMWAMRRGKSCQDSCGCRVVVANVTATKPRAIGTVDMPSE